MIESTAMSRPVARRSPHAVAPRVDAVAPRVDDPATPRAGAAVVAATVLAAALASSATPARAQPADREAAATAAYEAGDLDTALREFVAAHAETGRPDLLYVIGRLHAERKACRLAIEHFTRFLDSKPGPRAAEAAQAEVDACQAILDAEHARGGGGDGASAPGGDDVRGPAAGGAITTPPADAGARRFHRDVVGMSLVGAGVVAEVAAIVLYTRARAAQCGDPVCAGTSYDAYLAAEDRARSLRLTSVIVAGVGGALLAGGVVRYLTFDRGREPSLAVVPAAGGATVVLGGSF